MHLLRSFRNLSLRAFDFRTRVTLDVPTRTCFTAPPPNATMRALQPDGAGSVAVVDVPVPDPGAGEVLMRVRAVGANRADLLQIAGKYPAPEGATATLGLEAAGDLSDGRRVGALLVAGGFAEYAVVPESAVLELPGVHSMAELAAIPEAFVAAYHVLFDVGGFSAGQTVVLNAAASGVGIAALQLALTVPDVTVVAAVGSDEKAAAVHALLPAPNLHLVNYRSHSIAQAVHSATDGHGAHLALDCVGPAHFRELEKALAPNATWVVYGLLSGARGDRVGLAGIVSKHLTVRGTTLRSRSEGDRARIITAFVDRFGHRFATGGDNSNNSDSTAVQHGRLRPVIHAQLHGLENAAQAFAILENNENVGKVILTL